MSKREADLPRFYFDVRKGMRFTSDQNGIEFETLEAAERQAVRAATAMAQDRLPKGSAGDITVEVTNEHHRRMLTVTVSISIYREGSEPTTGKASEYRDRARSARAIAQWASDQADQAELLHSVKHWVAKAEAEERRIQDQASSGARED